MTFTADLTERAKALAAEQAAELAWAKTVDAEEHLWRCARWWRSRIGVGCPEIALALPYYYGSGGLHGLFITDDDWLLYLSWADRSFIEGGLHLVLDREYDPQQQRDRYILLRDDGPDVDNAILLAELLNGAAPAYESPLNQCEMGEYLHPGSYTETNWARHEVNQYDWSKMTVAQIEQAILLAGRVASDLPSLSAYSYRTESTP